MTDTRDHPLVSVILCTYSMDSFPHFVEAAGSVLDQTYDRVELVVVVDGKQEVFDRAVVEYGEHRDVVLHMNERNVGLLESRNTGAEIAQGDIVAFIDDDAVADERWIAELVRTFEDTGALAAGGKMTPDWVAGRPAFLPEEFYWLVGVTHRGFPEGPTEVRNTFGSNIAFCRSIFLDLNGFDTGIGGRQGDRNLQGGETELCARLQVEFGAGVQYNPDARVAHKVFDYRTEVCWLLDRAFWQGYSKRAMETLVPDAGSEEQAFLKRLFVEFFPNRIGGLVRRPSTGSLLKLGMLALLTLTVAGGYAYGLLRYPPIAQQRD